MTRHEIRHDVILNFVLFFFKVTATTQIYTLSLHDALPILPASARERAGGTLGRPQPFLRGRGREEMVARSEEHTSELQSQSNIVCRLLLEKKKYVSMIAPAMRLLGKASHKECSSIVASLPT